MGSQKWSREIHRVAKRTAAEISAAMNDMVLDLPEGAAPDVAMARVVQVLGGHQPRFMQLIMEDPVFREAYEAGVAKRPATPSAGAQMV